MEQSKIDRTTAGTEYIPGLRLTYTKRRNVGSDEQLAAMSSICKYRESEDVPLQPAPYSHEHDEIKHLEREMKEIPQKYKNERKQCNAYRFSKKKRC